MEVFVKKAYVIFMKQVVFKILQEGPVKFEHNNVMLFRPNIDGDMLGYIYTVIFVKIPLKWWFFLKQKDSSNETSDHTTGQGLS